jgi:hypothetical protein
MIVDPDALDALMGRGDTVWELRMTILDHSVMVNSEGIIRVDGNQYSLYRN